MSARSTADKLLIKPGAAVWVGPPSRLDLIGALPEGVRTVETPADATTAIVFAEDAAAVRSAFAANRDALAAAAVLWVAYPKAGRADINRDSLWPILAGYGLRPIGQVAIDDVWSALRFRALAEGESPFAGGR
jgi:hypothetical protein